MNYSSTSDIVSEICKQQEDIILRQLNDLIRRGLLVIESTRPVLVQDPISNGVVLQQSVRLTLKDKEYIEELEIENNKLKCQLNAMYKTAEEILNERNKG